MPNRSKRCDPGCFFITLCIASVVFAAGCTRRPPNGEASSPETGDLDVPAAEDLQLSIPSGGAMKEEEVMSKNVPRQLLDAYDEQEQGYENERARMVEHQLAARDISDRRVLEAMARVPRHKFVPAAERHLAYADSPLPIGHAQTISQPYIVALMTQLVDPRPDSKALDIGTGSGYQAAVLAELVANVYSIEIVEPLASEARVLLQSLGYENIHVRHGDGYRGWPEHAPFDIIIVAAAPDHIPEPLMEQLAPGGKMLIPVGKFYQELVVVEKAEDGTVTKRNVAPVAFVPMTGEAQK